MNVERDLRMTWENNGNLSRERGMDESPYSLSRADCNSNQIISTADPNFKQEICGHSQQCQNKTSTSHNRTFSRARSSSTLNSPNNVFNASFCQKDLSYDDLSKNIDANLAEIDMETFRSEDINSILALPAIYSGNFESVCHGEQCASVSGSLLNGLEIDVSVNNRTSEDEISICKDEPLFSPQREPPNQERAISVDSLDNSSSYDQDLVLTCKANKNNYTIVFEGSETQFSEESEYHNTSRSSVSSTSDALPVNSETSNTSGSMIQSDLVFTTWSNLKRLPLGGKRRKSMLHNASLKSQSLPDLNQPVASILDRSWSKLHGKKNAASVCDLDCYQRSKGLQLLRNSRYPYSLSLVKLFMKYKVSSRLSDCSNEDLSSFSSVIHSLNNINHGMPNFSDQLEGKGKDSLLNQNFNIKSQLFERVENQNRQMYMDNIRLLDWNSARGETNNNTINSLPLSGGKFVNRNISKEENSVTPTEECDNSQVFEDSLIEPPLLQLKNFHTTPIKEEEEADMSSGDEAMKSSKGSNEASNDHTMVKNNAVSQKSNALRSDADLNLERINNVFPSSKSNTSCAAEAQTATEHVEKNLTMDTILLENQNVGISHAKPYNSKNIENLNLQNNSGKAGSKQACSVEQLKQYSTSRDTSPNSSGYVSSRHSSVERMPRSCAGLNVDSSKLGSGSHKVKSNVFLCTTRTFGTQVPVHVIDRSMQTSTLARSHPNVGFLLTDSNDNIAQSSYKCPSPKESMQAAHTSMMSKSCTKEDKCIYVCFPNYSLPDLSFLKSVMKEESTSVFLSPTKFKPPQTPLKSQHIRPRSCDGLDPNSKKRLSDIKDWDSLNILLPDNFKHLISQMQMQSVKSESTSGKGGLNTSSDLHSSTRGTKPDFTKYLIQDQKLSSHGILRKGSANQKKAQESQLLSSYACSNVCTCSDRNCDHTKKQEVPACSCHQISFASNSPYKTSPLILPKHDAAFHTKPSAFQYKMAEHITKHNQPIFKKGGCTCFDCGPSKCSFQSVQGNAERAFCFKQKIVASNMPAFHSGSKNQKLSQKDSNPKCDKDSVQNPSNPGLELDNMQNDPCITTPDEENITHKSYFDLEKIPDELLMSSTQNATPYTVPPDLYLLQNSLEGGKKLFYESLKRKTGLVENLQKAALLICEHFSNIKKHLVSSCTSFSVGQKILTSLCPAVHTILSDGLLPSVQGFFGLIPNSPWKVAEASVQLEKSKKEVQDLLAHVNSEKLLTDSTYRFNAFIIGLLNLGCLEWWLGHLLSSQSLISYHYHPTALLSLLALPASSHLKQELTELVSPLTSLSFNLDLAFETKLSTAKQHSNCKVQCIKEGNQEVLNDHKASKFPSHLQDLSSGQNGDASSHVNKCSQLKECPTWPDVAINQIHRHHHKKTEHRYSVPNSGLEKHYYNAEQGFCCSPGRVLVNEAPLLCSADSGCSSQVGHPHENAAATDILESVAQDASKAGHPFKQLQQKWEKITLGIEKEAAAAPISDATTKSGTRSPKKLVDAQRKSNKSHLSIKIAGEADRSHAKRAVSQPISGKKFTNDHVDIYYERKFETPDVVASSKLHHTPDKEKKSRSQIPTLKLGINMQPKSRIPIQRAAGPKPNSKYTKQQ